MTSPRTLFRDRRLVLLFVAVYMVAIILFAGEPSAAAQIVAAGGVALSIGLAVELQGWLGASLLALVCVTITFGMENLGVATGFPFGHYHFNVAPGLPHIGTIPIVVGPLYFGVGYLAWLIAGILLDDADLKLSEVFNVFALPLIASFVMLQWDLVMDPPNSTLAHAWVWHDGGGYFGVPLSNYLGWFLTVWLFFQAFALMLRRWPAQFCRPNYGFRRDVQMTAVLLYLAIALSFVIPFLLAKNDVTLDPSGWAWRAKDVREGSVIVMALSMVPTAALALLRLLRPRQV